MRNLRRSLAVAGLSAVAALILTAPQAAADEAAAAQSLSCKKHVGGKTGWVECKGKGQWRTISICNFEQDRTSEWYKQNGGTKRKAVLKCWWDLADIKIEKR
ncbi:hypothetical protein JO379_005229 [Streptomyces syringium]|uniref:Uncharacterized protein n=1 Tax=Streptomyces syringium TaxID=76729 RepID=A0ABS4YAG0_9ACTN|nr:hypothetical protein [Streptomyces syringium]